LPDTKTQRLSDTARDYVSLSAEKEAGGLFNEEEGPTEGWLLQAP